MDSKHGKLTIALRKTAIGAGFLFVVVLALLKRHLEDALATALIGRVK